MADYNVFHWIGFFMAYSFLGWLSEGIIAFIRKKKWVNRGILRGPILPIYGYGALFVFVVTYPVRKHVIWLFLLGSLAATVMEYVTGYVMDRLYEVKYWDYSNQPLNLNGYICLLCSLQWGGYTLLMTYVLHPLLERLILGIPNVLLCGVGIILLACYILDEYLCAVKPCIGGEDGLGKESLANGNGRSENRRKKDALTGERPL